MLKPLTRSLLFAMCVVAAGCGDDSGKSNPSQPTVPKSCDIACVHGTCIVQNDVETCRCNTGYVTDAQGLCTACDTGYQVSGNECIEGPVKLPEWDPSSEHADIAPSYANLSGDALYDILGAKIVDGGVNFAVFAEHATRVEVLIFDANHPDTDLPLARLPMKKDANSGIWTIFVKDLTAGAHYGYIAFGPNWVYDESFKPGTIIGMYQGCDTDGNRYNPNKLLIDPYARRIHRDFDWTNGNPFSGEGMDVSDWKAAPKSVVVESKYQWSEQEAEWRSRRELGDNFEGHAARDLIIYEVHPKGFTAGDPSIAAPGSFKAIGEKAQYLADLGVTAVQLMPVTESSEFNGHWRYDPIAFFAPEQSYASQAARNRPEGVIDEFKEMVDKLHQAGIEVILDVVYNHAGEAGVGFDTAEKVFDFGSMNSFKDDSATMIFSLRGLDNKAYYHLMKNANYVPNLGYLDQTGTGNQIRTNYKPGKRLIMDSLHFWVEEMHVDGFHFDIASILGVTDEQVTQDGDTQVFNDVFWADHVHETILQDMVDDDLLAKYHTRLIAEPWSYGQYVSGLFPKSTKHQNYAWFEQTIYFSDFIHRIINHDDSNLTIKAITPNSQIEISYDNILTGSSNLFGDAGDERKPYHSINYLSNHYDFTFYDLNSYSEKNNGCSKINDICCNQSNHLFCQLDTGGGNSYLRDWCGGNKNEMGTCNDANAEAYKRQIIRNDFVLLLISNGTPFILGGDEYMRTQFGNNYPSFNDNEWNWFRWNDWLNDADRVRMHDFVRDLIKIRKQYKAFLAPAEYNSNWIQWHGPEGVSEDMVWYGRAIAQYYPAKSGTDSLFIMMNMFEDSRNFILPESGDWQVLVDTQLYFENPANGGKNVWNRGERVTSGNYEVPGRTIVIVGK